MLEDVLKAVKCSEVHQIVLISSDPVVKKFAHNQLKVTFLHEKRQGLNKAVDQATRWCLQKGAESVLVLPADIPLLKPEDVNKIVCLSSEKSSVVVSPSKKGGTNALLMKPPNIIRPRFGPNSFRKHLDEASTRKIPCKIYLSKRVSLDIDSVEDLKLLLKTDEATASHKFLRSININMSLKPKT